VLLPPPIKHPVTVHGEDGNWVFAVNSWRTDLFGWNTEFSNFVGSRQLIYSNGHVSSIASLAVSEDASLLAGGSLDGTVRVWRRDSDKAFRLIFSQKAHAKTVWTLRFAPDKSMLASGSEDGTVRIWPVRSLLGTVKSEMLSPKGRSLGRLVISPGGRWLAVEASRIEAPGAETLAETLLWRIVGGKPIGEPILLKGFCAAFSGDERLLASVDGSVIYVWALGRTVPTRPKVSLRGHTGDINAIDLSRDGRWLVSAGGDGSARLWDLNAPSGAESAVILRGHEGSVFGAVFSKDSKWVVTGGEDRTARI
jgi:WD40 repeat protein